MGRKVWLLLIPFIAILFVVNSNGSSSFAGRYPEQAASIVAAQHSVHAVNYSLEKSPHTPDKNKIRIKAWDDVAPGILPPAFSAYTPSFYSQRVYSRRSVHVPTAFLSSEFLRGPPSVS